MCCIHSTVGRGLSVGCDYLPDVCAWLCVVDMNDQDYIRRAVELADGWSWSTIYDDHVCILNEGNPYGWHTRADQIIKDALAAQLVRQVCVMPEYDVIISKDGTEVFSGGHVKGIEYDIKTIAMARGNDITMNTIKAIVDSGVLE